MLTDGEAVTEAEDVLLKPVDGVHEYVVPVAPLAVREVLVVVPLQIKAPAEGDTDKFGTGLIVIVTGVVVCHKPEVAHVTEQRTIVVVVIAPGFSRAVVPPE